METTYNYGVTFGTASDPPSGAYVAADFTGLTTYAFASGTKIILVFAHNAQLVIRFRYSATAAWGNDIVLWDAPQAEPIYLSAQYFQVQNYVAGSPCIFQVIGQW